MDANHLGFPLQTVVVFVVFVLVAFMVDFMAHKRDEVITLKSATLWSIFWIGVSILFGGFILWQHGTEMASLFFTGYALEKVLSVDNLFVMMAIFAWFKVPDKFRHRILYFGIIGAIIFRLIFVGIGTSLLMIGPWVEIVFALIVAWTAVMMLKSGDDDEQEVDYSKHLAYRLVYKFFPVHPKLVGHSFFLNKDELAKEQIKPNTSKSLFVATPLFLCLAVIELSDVMFAFDSVPAIIAISREPLIVYSAMMFAILGLRTLYFVLEALKQYLVHLEKAVIVLLFFIAAKLALNASAHIWGHGLEISASLSLWIVLGVLACGILASFVFPVKNEE